MNFENMMEQFKIESEEKLNQINKRNVKNNTKKRHIKGSYIKGCKNNCKY